MPAHKHLKTSEAILFRPIEANLSEETNKCAYIDAYCDIKVGWHSQKTAANHYTLNPTWLDAIIVKRSHGEKYAKVSVKDKTGSGLTYKLGKTYIDLSEIVEQKKVTKWYQLKKGHKEAGKILLDITYLH